MGGEEIGQGKTHRIDRGQAKPENKAQRGKTGKNDRVFGDYFSGVTALQREVIDIDAYSR